MKKTIYFLLAGLLVTATLPAQLVLESPLNALRPGDKLSKQEVRFKEPGRAGKDVLWDFSKLTPVVKKKFILTKPIEEIGYNNDVSPYVKEVDDNYTTVSYWRQDSTNRISAIENGSIYRFNNGGDSLLVWGYEIPTTKIENTQPELWLTFPFKFKDSLISYYNGEGIYCDQLNVNVMGSIEVEADAYGMMITPDKDTLTNVLRVRTLKTTLDDRSTLFFKKNGKPAKIKGDSIAFALKNNKASLIKTEIIRWYGEGFRYPVFETWRTYTDKDGKKSDENLQAFFYDPIQQEQEYLKTDTANQTILANNKLKKEKNKNKEGKEGKEVLKSAPFTTGIGLLSGMEYYNIYPNPTERDVEVEIYLLQESALKIVVYDISGKAVIQSNTRAGAGIYRETIPTASLPKGNYILHIACGEKVITEKIIKQ